MHTKKYRASPLTDKKKSTTFQTPPLLLQFRCLQPMRPQFLCSSLLAPLNRHHAGKALCEQMAWSGWSKLLSWVSNP
jgi:hypothetical protein